MKLFKGRRKLAVVAGGIGAVVISTAAVAAVLFFTTGSFTASAAPTPTLTINSATLTGPLVPGQPAVGGIVNITNPNSFPVNVTRVLVKSSGLAVTPATCDIRSLTLGGVDGSINSVPGKVFDIADVTIPAGGTENINVPAVVSQAGSATVLCGVQGEYIVEGSVGN